MSKPELLKLHDKVQSDVSERLTSDMSFGYGITENVDRLTSSPKEISIENVSIQTSHINNPDLLDSLEPSCHKDKPLDNSTTNESEYAFNPRPQILRPRLDLSKVKPSFPEVPLMSTSRSRNAGN